MANHLVLVDGNNIGFSAMASPILLSGAKQTNGTFTFVRKIRDLFLEFPNAMIMVLWDGASWRKDIYKEYKEKRQSTEKQQDQRQEYYDQKPDMQKALTLLGIAQCFSINMEADDLAEIYSRKWKGDKVTLVSGDQDWIQLVDERVTWFDPVRDRIVTSSNFQTTTGYLDAKQFVEAKSILGDKDEVPGIKGIGPGTLEKLYQSYSSFRHFLIELNDSSSYVEVEWFKKHGKKMPKVLRELGIDITLKQLDFNDKLGDLRTEHRPEPINLKRSQKPIDVAGFEDFCYTLGFMSITRKLDIFVKPIIDNRHILHNR
jgi:DNA polymerase I